MREAKRRVWVLQDFAGDWGTLAEFGRLCLRLEDFAGLRMALQDFARLLQ